ncbi:MAG TPA: arginine--tRNA ligase [Phototrophicaceae bacterium]|nr:arginine--tRNA ligase [Phototrophicaceae bacterium]
MILLPQAHAQLITQAIKVAQAAGDLPAFDMPTIDIKPPKNASQGDYACPVAMALAKPLNLKPLDVANTIVKHIQRPEFLASVDVAPPGFINFRLSDEWLRGLVDEVIAEGDSLFKLELGKGKRAQVEFVSANPTGPLHVGRSRGAMVGDSMARILEAAGYDVQREYYFNNAGVQMKNLGKSMQIRYLEALKFPVEIPDEKDASFYQGEYLIDFAKDLVTEVGNTWAEESWKPFKEYVEKKMFEVIKQTLQRVDIQHDHFFNENSLYDSGVVWDVLKRLEAGGYVYEDVVREGESEEVRAASRGLMPAKWFRSTSLGDKEDRVVVKSNGDPTYTLPDIAYHINKLGRDFDVLVNVLGADHYIEAQVVRWGLQALNYDTSKLHVILIQLVRMVRDGQPVKMSTRRGDYETLDDLIDLTSADAVRYILLARSPESQMDFDLDLAVKQTNENPVYYIQYAYVRCAGIFREAEARSFTDDTVDLSLLGEDELIFLRKVLTLGDEIEFAATNFAPHKVAFFALELANAFHPLYDRVRVFGEGVPEDVAKTRLHFYRAALVAFKRVLTMMGMSLPDRM